MRTIAWLCDVQSWEWIPKADIIMYVNLKNKNDFKMEKIKIK